MIYDWRNVKTGKVVEHDHWSTPPDLPGKWERVFWFTVGKIEGGGGGRAGKGPKLKKPKSARTIG